MTEQELQQIKDRNAARTPGDWELGSWSRYGVCVQAVAGPKPIICWLNDVARESDTVGCGLDDPRGNFTFIASAPNDVTQLIQEVEECWAIIHDLKEDSPAYKRGVERGILEGRAALRKNAEKLLAIARGLIVEHRSQTIDVNTWAHMEQLSIVLNTIEAEIQS